MFEHFSILIQETKNKRYYVCTKGYAFTICRKTGAFNLLNVREDNRVKIANKLISQPALIYKTVYCGWGKNARKIENLIYIDGDKKNHNIENLANLPYGQTAKKMSIKDNYTGVCKNVETFEFVSFLQRLNKKSMLVIERPHFYMIQTKRFTLFQQQGMPKIVYNALLEGVSKTGHFEYAQIA